ncbi:hypothetical protein HZR84_13900 [Hyphobacterium sp. CCMP332]|nr:hypothetical protein HZR84_13900 [Hyphobacterium sp. CCMP332]
MLDRITRNKICRIQYKINDEIEFYEGQLYDIYSKLGEEYLIGENDFKIRLDKIMFLDDIENK